MDLTNPLSVRSEAPGDGRPLAPGPLVLASASRTRRRLLDQAGIAYLADAPDLDEGVLRAAARHRGEDAETAATALAAAKAVAISERRPDAVVIGADQILECDGRWFEKPNELDAARAALLALRDRRHRLISAVAVAQGGHCCWRHVDVATMTMRPFSQAFLSHYLETAAGDALDTVAGYRYEGPGVQLFSATDGDIFTILGLPLLALFAYLREQGVLLD
ncbi:MAG: Maf family protein [Rhodospirillales bacterium]|nr:Maf family protein [Rhodospirillales bacterium]